MVGVGGEKEGGTEVVMKWRARDDGSEAVRRRFFFFLFERRMRKWISRLVWR